MTQQESVWSRSPAVAFVDNGERIALLVLKAAPSQHPYVFHGSACAIWRALDVEISALDIARLIADAAEAPFEHVFTETTQFLERLRELGMVQLVADVPPLTYRLREG
jgi:hypothetical protein